jgi:hypothetical protein
VIIGNGAGRGASEVKGGDSSSVVFAGFRRRRRYRKKRMAMAMSRRKVRTPRTRETVMFVRVRLAFEVRREEACARPAVAAGFGSAVTEKETEVCVAVETMFVFVDKTAVVVVVVSVLVAKVVIVVSSILGRIVRVVVTVGSGGKPSRDVGNGRPVGKGKGGNPPNCLPDNVTVALPPPSVKLAGTDIQVSFSGRPRFSRSSVVQPAVVT